MLTKLVTKTYYQCLDSATCLGGFPQSLTIFEKFWVLQIRNNPSLRASQALTRLRKWSANLSDSWTIVSVGFA